MKPLLLLALLLSGCASRPIRKPHDDTIGASPYLEGGEYKCGNNHYKYRPWTGKCERE